MRTATIAAPMYHGFVARRRGHALFFGWIAQHVRSLVLLREIARMVLALGGIAAWGAVMLLLAA